MDVAYVAQTESCVFLLDGDGFCRAAIPAPEADDAARKAALRCMDAQYVASLDTSVEGLLASDPKVGRALLFAKVSKEGRVALIRTAALLEIRSLDGPMPVIAAEPVADAIDLEEDPDEKLETSEHAKAPSAPDAPESDDCLELTAPFSREQRTGHPIVALAPLLGQTGQDDVDDVTRDDFTKIVDRESDRTLDQPVKESVIKTIAAKEIALPADRDSAPSTVAAPRTVRGFPPPPPIPITSGASRRGILPRRA